MSTLSTILDLLVNHLWSWCQMLRAHQCKQSLVGLALGVPCTFTWCLFSYSLSVCSCYLFLSFYWFYFFLKILWSIKNIKIGLSNICAICFIESPLKMIKNDFYFILKALFGLKIFKLSWLFGHVEKTAWLER